MRRVVWVTAFSLLVLAQSACELTRDAQPSILLVAVEGLSFESVSCDSEELEGLKAFCEESVRFSHAYTPSTMSQAAMASLLTGLYPFDHGVRHNGDGFLSARFRTLGEGALSRHYRTHFVSGGPPIWRKSGLAQGFEVFNDTMDLAPSVYYRPASEVVRLATQWIEAQDDGSPILSVLFFADLQFPETSTVTRDGEVREKSAKAQLAEVIESTGELVQWLKRNKRWNTTHVILVGLSSIDHAEGAEPNTLSMRSRANQVTLFIKPARKERDNVIQWAVDRNVSLVDVGHTMFTWLGLDAPPSTLAELQPQNLQSALSQGQPDWQEGRLVLSETAWPEWLEGAGQRWALRQNQFLYVHDKRPLIFNTLTDRLENLPLRSSDPLWNSVNQDVMEVLARSKTLPFNGMTSHWPAQLAAGRALWTELGQARVPGESDMGEPWVKWYLRRAMEKGLWREVKRLSQELGEPVGGFIAAKHLGETLPTPRNPCLRMMIPVKGDKRNYQADCEDERMLALHAWHRAGTEEEKAAAQERFLRMMGQLAMDQEIGRLNYLNDLRWDVDREWPEAPQAVEYLLTLKEYEPYAKRLAAFLSRKDARL